MTNGDLETYGTAYFSVAEISTGRNVEFNLKSSTLIRTVEVYGDYRELLHLTVLVDGLDGWYCGI